MTTIRYFLPEDGDTELHPNVFLAPKPSRPGAAPTLGQVKEAFPLPGRYHFRFKSPLFPGADREKNSMAVWMDCVEDSQPVSTWRNAIIAKVSRVGMDDDEYDDDDDDVDFGGMHADVSTHSEPAAPTTDPGLGLFDDPSPPVVSSNPPSSHSSVDNLLNVGGAPAPAPAAGMDAGLLDLNAPVAATQPETPSTAHHDDFLHMSAPAPAPAAPTPPPVASPSPVPAPAPAPKSGMGSSYGSNHYAPPSQTQQNITPPVPPRTAQQQHAYNRAGSGSGSQAQKNNAFEAFSKKKDKGQFGSLRWG